MRLNRLPYLFLFFLPLASCAAPGHAVKRPAGAVPAPPSPRTQQSQQPLTLKQKQLVEQLYYQAVSAYSEDDITTAAARLAEIFRLAPSYAPARELQEKIRLAGKKR